MKKDYSGKDLICRSCKGVFYKTTDKFDPSKLISANMFYMLEPYKSQGWSEFPKDPEGIGGYGQLTCPYCETEYADGNGFALIDGITTRTKPLKNIELSYIKRERKARFKPVVNDPTVTTVSAHMCGYCKAIYLDPEVAKNCLISCKEKISNGKD